MVAFGKAPAIPAHDGNHPLGGRRDREMEKPHEKAPPVPRAPRAPPRANSAGAFKRDAFTRPDNSVAKASELRRPREESPFARVSALTRERESVENQIFEMGPRRRPSSAPKVDFKRAHILGQERQCNDGIPWGAGKDDDADKPQRNPARRLTLQRENQAADQGLEWVPEVARPIGAGAAASAADFCRVNVLAREQATSVLDVQPMPTKDFGRRNVLKRESFTGASINTPMPSGYEAGCVPVYGRKQVLTRDQGISGVGGA